MKKRFLFISLFITGLTGVLGANYKPTLSKVYSNRFKAGQQQYNNAGTQGSLYTAFGTSGSLSLNSQVEGGQARAVQVLADSSMLVAMNDTTNSYVAQYNAQGSLISTFGTSGKVTLPSAVKVRALQLDGQGRILVAGGDTTGTAGWLKRLAGNGSSTTSFVTGSNWQFIGALAQQSSGKIIAAGFNGTNAQISRFNLDGSVDLTFGTSGYLVFDGNSSHPTSTAGLYNVVIDSNDNIYIAYVQSSTVKVAKFDLNGTLVGSFGTSGIVTVNALANATASQLRMAFTAAGQLVIGAQVSSVIKVESITSSGATGSITNVSTSVFTDLYAIVPTTDGNILLIGSNATSQQMAVMRLNQYGDVDTSFNGTGYNLFNISSPTVASVLYGAALAPNGNIYAVGYQSTGGTPTLTPYVSQLYGTQYETPVAQYPLVSSQGYLDTSFGSVATESIRGVTMPYNGFFHDALLQKTRAIVEISGGDLLVGYDGCTDSSNIRTAMLAWLTADGVLDTNYGTGSSGKLTLNFQGQMSSLAVGSSANIYVAGTTNGGQPGLYAYNASSTNNWIASNSAWNNTDTGTAAVGVAVQGTAGVLLFCQDTSTIGHISRYTTNGILDTNFGSSGKVASGAYSLNMGPVYGGGIVDAAENIYIAYKNSSANTIDVALLTKNGTALIPEFGTNGVISNVFSSNAINANNVRIAFGVQSTILVAAINAAANQYLVRRYNAITGALDTTFNNGNILAITPETSVTALTLTNLVGLNDGSVMITGYDAQTDPVMLALRITANGSGLDTTFNSQGSVPGVLPLQIANEVANYTARNLSGIAVQSTGLNSGNIVFTAFEQESTSLSTPEVFRVYGKSGTTAVQRYPTVDQYPGTLDVSLNSCGAQDIASITHAGTGKIVYAYPDGNAHEGKLLVGVDTGSNIYLARVDEVTLAYDTTFNPSGATPGKYVVSSVTGLANVMVDRNNNIIMCGSQNSLGWAYQIPDDGNSSAISFSVPSDISGLNAVYQQQSGRYIFAGVNNATQGLIIAFQDVVVQPASMFAVDTSFNPLAVGGITGRYVIGSASTIPALTINYDDTILIGYNSTTVQVAKIAANGSGLASTFGTNGIVNTGITPANVTSIRVASNNNTSTGSVLVAASTSSGLSVIRYTSNGGTDTNWNSTGAITTVSGVGSAGITLTGLQVTESNLTILTGYNSTGTIHGNLFAVRLDSYGALDRSWNPNPVSPDVSGVLTFGAAGNPLTPAITSLYQSYVSVDGNVFCIGGNGTDPILMEVVGKSYDNQIQQGQIAGLAGFVDLTINQTTGALSLNTLTGSTLGATAKMYINQQGYMYFASNLGTSTNLTKLLPTMGLDTSFSSDGLLSIANIATCNDMFVADAQGQNGTIYVTGANNGHMVAASVSANGASTNSFVLPASLASWTVGYAVRLAYNGDVMIAGFDGTHGALVAMLPDGSQVDPLFATNGVYTTASTNPIVALAIDNQSRMYIAYLVSGARTTINIQRLTSAGVLDTTFGTDGTIILSGTSLSATQIKMAIDQTNNQLVVVAQDGQAIGNSLQVRRFSLDNGAAQGTGSVSVESKALTLSNVIINTLQQIYVIGMNITDLNVFVARFNATTGTTIALDDSYGIHGIANNAITNVTSYVTGQLDPDGRLYLAGNNVPTPYLSRLFGNNYYAQVSQAQPGFAPGLADVTYGTLGVQVNYAGGLTSAQITDCVLPFPSGSNLYAIVSNQDGSASWTMRLLSNGYSDATYRSAGVEITQASAGQESIAQMIFNGEDVTMLVGSNSLYGGFVKSILPTGQMNAGNFGGAVVNQKYEGIVYLSEFDSINAIAQLSNGQYIIGGSKDGVGQLALMYLNGQLVQSFGSQGIMTIQNSSDVTSLSVDSNNTVYAAVKYVISQNSVAGVYRLNTVTSEVTQYILPDAIITGDGSLRLALDTQNRIVIAVDAHDVTEVIRLVNDVVISIDSSFNDGNPCQIALPSPYYADLYSVQLSILQNNTILVAGKSWNQTSSYGVFCVASITADGVYDTSFNAQGSIPGLAMFACANNIRAEVDNISVQLDGQILLAGSQSDVSSVCTPITMRIDGYTNVASVPQFPAYTQPQPSPLNPDFGTNGIAYAPVPALQARTFVQGGQTAVDGHGRIIVGGRTSDGRLVVSRLLPDGTLDTSFSNDGFAQTGVISTLASGCFVVVDADNLPYIAGITTDYKFVVARFTESGTLDNNFGASGITTSNAVTNLSDGGYIALDYHNNVLVGGRTSDYKLVVARFTAAGAKDTNFDTDGIAFSAVIPSMRTGGYIVTPVHSDSLPDDNSIFIGCATYTNTLCVVKFDNTGTVVNSFGSAGIATSPAITNLVGGGFVGLTILRQIIVGGYTADNRFVASMMISDGTVVEAFGPLNNGIGYGNSFPSLTSVGNMNIDFNENIVFGGIASDIDGVSQSMIVTRLSNIGVPDTILSPSGNVTTGVIQGLTAGGYVTTNKLNQIFTGGNVISQVVISGMYSGAEIIIQYPTSLPAIAFSLYNYGNNSNLFRKFFGVEFLADVITNVDHRAGVVVAVNDSLLNFASIYENHPDIILVAAVWATWNGHLDQLRILLITLFPSSADEINAFFGLLLHRMKQTHDILADTSANSRY